MSGDRGGVKPQPSSSLLILAATRAHPTPPPPSDLHGGDKTAANHAKTPCPSEPAARETAAGPLPPLRSRSRSLRWSWPGFRVRIVAFPLGSCRSAAFAALKRRAGTPPNGRPRRGRERCRERHAFVSRMFPPRHKTGGSDEPRRARWRVSSRVSPPRAQRLAPCLSIFYIDKIASHSG